MDTIVTRIKTQAPHVHAMLRALESDLPRLQARHPHVLPAAWQQRAEGILGATPPALRQDVITRLGRIGIRWGLVPTGHGVSFATTLLAAHGER